MTERNLDQPPAHAAAHRILPWLLLLFVGSGCSALIYEIVWFQLLQLVIGSSAVSLGVLLGTFMGGMCLGSIALPRVVSPRRHPLRVYALIELGTGLIGILVLYAVPYVDHIYAESVGRGMPGILLRGAVCAACLLPPTLLMGATLPAISRWVETTPRGVSWLGFLYGGNIAGAVCGCLLAGFYLLRTQDMAVATYVAATINGSVAILSLALASLAPYRAPAGDPTVRVARPPGSSSVYLAIALSGLGALGAEVIWTRLLSLMLGATVYTFSIILAVFLLGLGIGSSVGAAVARAVARPQFALGCCQLSLVAAIAWTAHLLAHSLPYWPIDPSLSASPWFDFQLDLMRCVWAILPATCLWGASFPLALGAAASRGQDPGRLVGGIYAANTVGAIVGSLAFSMLIVPWLGTQQAQRVLIGLAAVAAVVTFAPLLWQRRSIASSSDWPPRRAMRLLGAISLLAAVGIATLLARSVCEVPWAVVAFGRALPTWKTLPEIIYVGEGMNASVAVSEFVTGVRSFHVAGKVEASSDPQDMRLQRMLGHMSALLHPKPRSVLVVGCGAGVTAGSFELHPDVERIVICEIEPLIPPLAARYFAEENYGVLDDTRRVEVVYDDARHYISTTQEKFDVITSDPIHPWVKGSAMLYSQEYFELCRRHLNPGGVITQWVPLYESDFRTVKSEIATFLQVFPQGIIWSNEENGEGYDVVLMGRAGQTSIDVDGLQNRLDRSDHSSVAESLRQVGFPSAVTLLATYAGQGPDLGPWLKNAEINRDRNLRLQYLAGMGLNGFESKLIYDDLLLYRKFPENLFVASAERARWLREAIMQPRAGQ